MPCATQKTTIRKVHYSGHPSRPIALCGREVYGMANVTDDPKQVTCLQCRAIIEKVKR